MNNIDDDVIDAQRLLIKFHNAPWTTTVTETMIDDGLTVNRIVNNTGGDQ